MYNIGVLLLPFLQLNILSASRCLESLFFTGISEMWKGEKCKMFINIFFLSKAGSQYLSYLYEKVGWILKFKGKTRWFYLLDNFLEQKGVMAETKVEQIWRVYLVQMYFLHLQLNCTSEGWSSVSNHLACSGKLVFAMIIFKEFVYCCPHSKHLQLPCSLC